MTELETLKGLKGIYYLILSSPELIVQLSIGNKISVAQTYKDLTRSFELAESKIREMEIEEAKQPERTPSQ